MGEERRGLGAGRRVGDPAVEGVPGDALPLEEGVGAAVGVGLEGARGRGLAGLGGGAVEARVARVDGDGVEAEALRGELEGRRVEVDEAALLEVEGDDGDGLGVAAGDLAEAAALVCDAVA